MHKGISSITKYYKNTYVGGLGANLQIIIIFLAFLSHIRIFSNPIYVRALLCVLYDVASPRAAVSAPEYNIIST